MTYLSPKAISLQSLDRETVAMMIAAQPELRHFLDEHQDCAECSVLLDEEGGLYFSRTKLHCAECEQAEGICGICETRHSASVECDPRLPPHPTIKLYGGALAALKRIKSGKPHKQVHRKKAQDRLRAQKRKMQ